MTGLLEYLPLLILGVLVLSVRANHEKNVRLLSGPQRARLYETFTRYRLLQYGAIFLILAPVVAVLQGALEAATAWAGLGLAAVGLGVFLTLGYRLLRRRLEEIEMPSTYVDAYVRDRLMIGILMGVLLFQAGRKLLGY